MRVCSACARVCIYRGTAMVGGCIILYYYYYIRYNGRTGSSVFGFYTANGTRPTAYEPPSLTRWRRYKNGATTDGARWGTPWHRAHNSHAALCSGGSYLIPEGNVERVNMKMIPGLARGRKLKYSEKREESLKKYDITRHNRYEILK